MDKDALIAQITAAFNGVAREDGVSLREGMVLDNYGSKEECAAARLLDTDTRWQDVTDEDLREYAISLSYFDAKGFRYYLPAYLIRELRQNETAEDGFYTDMLFDLRLPLDKRMRDYKLEHFSLITPEQGKAVCCFLEFAATHGYEQQQQEASDALAAYWSRYQ